MQAAGRAGVAPPLRRGRTQHNGTDVARSLRKYQDLGVTHFVLSDTPYLAEIKRQGDQLLPLLRS